MSQLSPNAMKSVIDIDVLGSYNTLKATLPYLLESAAKHRTDGRTRKLKTNIAKLDQGCQTMSDPETPPNSMS